MVLEIKPRFALTEEAPTSQLNSVYPRISRFPLPELSVIELCGFYFFTLTFKNFRRMAICLCFFCGLPFTAIGFLLHYTNTTH